jgi:hypothetical protein
VPPLAVKVTLVPWQKVLPTAELLIVGTGNGFTTIVIELEFAILEVTQVNEEVIVTDTTSLFARLADVKLGLFVPALTPLIFHWYAGVPPSVGVAVNVTEVPAQIAPDGAAVMLTAGVSGEVTIMVIEEEVAGLPVVQSALEVSSHVTTSPLRGV